MAGLGTTSSWCQWKPLGNWWFPPTAGKSGLAIVLAFLRSYTIPWIEAYQYICLLCTDVKSLWIHSFVHSFVREFIHYSMRWPHCLSLHLFIFYSWPQWGLHHGKHQNWWMLKKEESMYAVCIDVCSMYACMYVCMYVPIKARIYIYMYVCMYTLT